MEHSEWVQSELKRSNEDLRRANQDLETFAYSASHDLQEPLRNIAIFAQLLEKRLNGRLDSDETAFLEGVMKGTRRMDSLVQDLLAYSRATRTVEGEVPVIDSGVVLSGVLRNMHARIEEAGAAITCGDLPEVPIHHMHLEQIFRNLLSNAIKFRDQKSRQTPQAHISAQPRDGWWVISVADNGIGIDPRYASQIFGLFKRLHSRSQYSGSGVGLAVCRRILEQYGGRIWLETPRTGTGCVFSFTLPARRRD